MRKKPKFLRQGAKNLKKLGSKWRRPRGSQSKLRKHKKSRGFIPQVGYGTPRSTRGLHPSGFEEVLISNENDLQKIDPKKQVAKIRKQVGLKKRIEIQKKAAELKIKILNPTKQKKKKQVKKKIEKPEKKEKTEV